MHIYRRASRERLVFVHISILSTSYILVGYRAIYTNGINCYYSLVSKQSIQAHNVNCSFYQRRCQPFCPRELFRMKVIYIILGKQLVSKSLPPQPTTFLIIYNSLDGFVGVALRSNMVQPPEVMQIYVYLPSYCSGQQHYVFIKYLAKPQSLAHFKHAQSSQHYLSDTDMCVVHTFMHVLLQMRFI